jgi:dTDP-glucose pyrophosphorylase
MKNVLILEENIGFYELLKKLDEEGNGFLVIVDNAYKLIGIVTDGDIRRSVLNKQTDDINRIINHQPLTASSETDTHEIQQYLKSIKRRQIPIVNRDNILVDIVYLDDHEAHYNENFVVIMAGGLGSRLGELTKDIPKPMLKIGDKPILERIIMTFKDAGYNKFIICVNYKSEIIKDYFKDGSDFGVFISYNDEEKKMGTAGALGLIKQAFNHPFFVVNGDILTTIQYADFMTFNIRSSATATMCVKKMGYQIPYACINLDDDSNILGLVEKPIYDYKINAGLYILNPEVISRIPVNEYYDMTSLFETLIHHRKKVVAYCHEDYWLDIGHKADYHKANSDLNIHQ